MEVGLGITDGLTIKSATRRYDEVMNGNHRRRWVGLNFHIFWFSLKSARGNVRALSRNCARSAHAEALLFVHES